MSLPASPEARREAFARAVHAGRVAALERRAAAQPAAVQALLHSRMPAPPPAMPGATPPAEPARPLAELLAHIGRQSAPGATAVALAPQPKAAAGPQELRAVRAWRGTWSQLAVQRRVTQALAQVPPQAGPLNTQRLVHEVLSTLDALAPAYLHRLVAQLEALLWLEREAQGPRPRATARPGGRAPG